MFYKVIFNQEVIDVLQTIVYVKYQFRNSLILLCNDKSEACGIQSSDQTEFYHLDELLDFPLYNCKTVKLAEIAEDEYKILKEALDANKVIEEPEPEVPVPEEPEPQEPTDEEITDSNTLEMVRTAKVKTMSEACNQTIVNGIDVTLSDGISHHFELTTEEQLNLITLKEMIAQGVTSIPYHAKDELCKFYSVEDMTLIIETATQFKTYHTSYFNSLKNYINSMATIEEIGAVEYGIDIPAEYCSDVLLGMIKSIGAEGDAIETTD